MSKGTPKGKTSTKAEPGPNQDIIDMLIQAGEYERDVNGIIYKYHAFRKAATALGTLTSRVTSGAEAQKLPGIGPKISAKIQEFLDNGGEGETTSNQATSNGASEASQSSPKEKKSSKEKSSKQKSSKDNSKTVSSSPFKDQAVLDHFDKFYGMTKLDALNLEVNGVKSIADLEGVKTFLNPAQLICLQHFDDLCKMIPREEIRKFNELISKTVEKVSSSLVFTFCGDFRRKAKESRSMEVLVAHGDIKSDKSNAAVLLRESFETLVAALESASIIRVRVATETDKVVALCRLPGDKSGPLRLLNLHFVPRDHYVCRLLYHTGSEAFHERIVQHAMEHRYKLDKNSLRKKGYTNVDGEPIRLKQESELFEYLELAFVEPVQRNEA